MVQVSLVDWDLAKNYSAEIALKADVKETLRALIPALKSAGGADSGNSSRREAYREPFRKFGEFLIHVLDELLVLSRPALAVVPIVQSDEEESGVACADKAQEAEAGDASGVLHAGRVKQDLLDFLTGRLRTFERCSIGKLKMQEHVALIFPW